jgi:hypothetical protein
MHDWTQVDAGIYHAFHHRWISALTDILNAGTLPVDYYALAEQVAAGFEPDVLTLQGKSAIEPDDDESPAAGGTAMLLQSRPRTRFTAESTTEFYRRKKSSVVVRHVSGDPIVAVLEIVSPGNKSKRHAFQAFVDKACEFPEHRVHLLIVDPFPPGPRDPNGIHAAIWQEVQGEPFDLPADQPLTLVAYECDLMTRAYIEVVAVGQPLPDMPLFLAANSCVMVPLEATYQQAFSVMPLRWRSVLAPGEEHQL